MAHRQVDLPNPTTQRGFIRETWEAMYISSLWCDRGDRWLNTFSQDTPVDATAAVP